MPIFSKPSSRHFEKRSGLNSSAALAFVPMFIRTVLKNVGIVASALLTFEVDLISVGLIDRASDPRKEY
ncbi:hypothetical protein D3C86_1719260 [compost metagenome]